VAKSVGGLWQTRRAYLIPARLGTKCVIGRHCFAGSAYSLCLTAWSVPLHPSLGLLCVVLFSVRTFFYTYHQRGAHRTSRTVPVWCSYGTAYGTAFRVRSVRRVTYGATYSATHKARRASGCLLFSKPETGVLQATAQGHQQGFAYFWGAGCVFSAFVGGFSARVVRDVRVVPVLCSSAQCQMNLNWHTGGKRAPQAVFWRYFHLFSPLVVL
jgi:hypothetical protein